MAKFCGKCGSKLDEATGLCPKCDAEKLAKLSVESEKQEEKQKASIKSEKPLNKKEIKKQKKADKKADKKAAKKAKRAAMTIGQKVRKFFLRLIITLFILVILCSGALFALVHFNLVDYNSLYSSVRNIFSDNRIYDENIRVLDYKFTSITIMDENSAIQAAFDASKTLGYKNAFDELTPFKTTQIDGENYYRLQQNFRGIPVYNRYAIVIASDEGEALGLTTDAVDISDNMKTTPSVSVEIVHQRIEDFAINNWNIVYDNMDISELSEEALVIYIEDSSQQAYLAYKLLVANGNVYEVIVDAHTGNVLDYTALIDSVSDVGTNADGTKRFPVSYDEETNVYTLMDEDKSIYVFNLKKYSSKKEDYWAKKESVVSEGDPVFGNTTSETAQSPEIAINLLTNVESIANYFENTFGQGIPYGILITFYNDGYSGGKNALGGSLDATNEETGETYKWGFLSVGHKLTCTEMDVLAHEYTHIVAREYGAAVGSGQEAGSISEGLADTFACFFTEDWDIDLTVVGGTHRNAINPKEYNYPASINDGYFWSNEDQSHAYATVVSHAAYLMFNSGKFTRDELAKVWYKTILRLPSNCTFNNLRSCMEQTATVSGLSTAQKKAISDAFDEVGITGTTNFECKNEISISVTGKNGELYDDFTVQIDGKTSGGWFGIGSKPYSQTIESYNFEPCNLTLENGTYAIKVSDNANREEYKEFTVKVRKNYKEENLYVANFGADYTVQGNAKMMVLDAYGDTITNYSASVMNEDKHLANSLVDLDVRNYYTIVLSSNYPEAGVTYYDMFTLRVKNGAGDLLTVKTNFPTASDIKKETTVPAKKPNDAVEFNGHYYYIYDIDTIKDWNMAQEYCEAQGGYLATITSAEEDSFLYSYIVDAGYSSVMFGLTDQDRTDDWRWVTGESFSYQNWRSGEPNHQGGYEHYGMYYERNTDGTWNDGSGQGGPFICEWGEYTVAPGSESVQEPVRTTSDERDIVLVLDVSGSMAGTPMEETKKASVNFIDTILEEDASIGIVTYDNSASRVADFSVNKNSLKNVVSDIYDGGGTNIEAGLREAHSMLSSSNAKKKIIVLMSDGEPNDGKEGDALVAYADEIKEDGVLIYTLGFFESLGGYKSSAQQLMERIASDGCHYEVANADDLVFFFGDIADQLNGQKYIYVRIACPVDVSVTYQGQTLNSAESALSLRTDFGTLTFEENEEATQNGTDDRIKVLRLKEGTDYDLRLTGTGHGLMDYTIGFMDDEGNYSDLRKFEDVKITKRTVIDTVAETSKESVLNIDENGDGKYDLRLRAGENGYGEEIKQDYLVYAIVGGCAVLLLVVGIITVHKVRTKKKER